MSKHLNESVVSHVLARRTIREASAGGEVTITIGMPRQSGGLHERWECLFLIEGINEQRVQKAAGGDALQALLQAVQGVRWTLDRTGRHFEWLDGNPEFGSGIPRYIPMGMGARFEERVNLAIEREAKRVWEQRLRASQADIAACEAELKQRKELIAGLEKTLARRKAVATARAADFKKPRPR